MEHDQALPEKKIYARRQFCIQARLFDMRLHESENTRMEQQAPTAFSVEERQRGQFYAILTNLGSACSAALLTGPIMLLYATKVLGLSNTELGSILALTSLAVIFPFILTPLAPRFGKNRMVATGYALRTILLIPLFFISPETIPNHTLRLYAFGILVLLLDFTTKAITGSVWQPLMRDITTVDDRGRFYARMRMFFNGMAMTFFGVSILVIGKDISQTIYFGMLVVLLTMHILSVFAALKIPSVEAPTSTRRQGIGTYWRTFCHSPLFRWPLLIQFLCLIAGFPLLVLYFSSVLHTPDYINTAYTFILLLSTTVSFLYWGRISDMVGYKATIQGIALMHIVLIPIILFLTPLREDFPGLLNATLGEWTTIVLLGLLAMCSGAFGAGLGIGLASVQHHVVKDEDVLVAFPLWGVFTHGCMAFSAFLSGWVIDFSKLHPVDWGGPLDLDYVKLFLVGMALMIMGIWRWGQHLPDVRNMNTSDFYAAIFTNPLRPFLAGLQMYDPAEERRTSVVKSVSGTRNPFSIRVLCDMLDDPSYDVTVEAIRSLGNSRSPEAARKLLTLAMDDEYQYVREHVFWALGELRHEEAVDCLCAALSQEAHGHRVRAAAMRALGKIGNTAATPVVLDYIRNITMPKAIPLEIASACYALLRLNAVGETYHVCNLLTPLERSHSRYEILYLLFCMIGIEESWIMQTDSHMMPRDMLLIGIRKSGLPNTSPVSDLREALEKSDHAAMTSLLNQEIIHKGKNHTAAAAGLFRAFHEHTEWSILDNLVGGWLLKTYHMQEKS